MYVINMKHYYVYEVIEIFFLILLLNLKPTFTYESVPCTREWPNLNAPVENSLFNLGLICGL